jgi:uncharacterized protein (TIGR03085 family)
MTSPPDTTARRERLALCDLMLEVGPDAPTLCGDWTTRDLAAHLVMRERRPDAAAGIMISAMADHAEKVQHDIAAAEWTELVERVRSGPPMWSPARLAAVDKIINTVEFFVHHEDVRRAGEAWEQRELDTELEHRLYWALSKMGKRLVKSSEVGIVLQPTGGRAPITLKEASPSVTVAGPVGELVMFVYGRQAKSDVDLAGDDAAVEAVRTASFGV